MSVILRTVAEEEARELEINVPDDLEAGVCANVAAVWHTPYEFTIDFSVIQQGDQPSVRVVSRVRIPTTVIFDLLRALNSNMTKYEEAFGEIRRFEPPTPDEGEGDAADQNG